MTNAEYAASKGITLEQLRAENIEFLQSEGFDGAGNEYETLDAWLDRKPVKMTADPVDGNYASLEDPYANVFDLIK